MYKSFCSFLFIAILSFPLSASKADWVNQLEITGNITFKDVVIDDNGFSYSIGSFNDSVFVNTINGPVTLIDKKFGETFILKMDSCGQVIWAKQFFGTSRTDPSSIVLNSKGHLIISGRFSADTDFDPSSNVFTVNPAGGNAIYITTLDNDGNLLNVGRLGGSPGMYGNKIVVDDLDNIYVNVVFSGGAPNDPVDLDPNLNTTFFLSPTNGMDAAILKLDPQGDLDWVYHISGNGFQLIAGEIIVNGSEITAAFGFFGPISFDTNTGSQTLETKPSRYDGLIINLSTSKQFIGYSHLKGTENIIPSATKASKSSGTYVSGYFKDSLKVPLNGQTLEFKSSGDYDSFVGQWSTKGDLSWIQHLSSQNGAFIWSMDVADNGDIYLFGNFRDTLRIGEGKGSNQLISTNKNSTFLVILDSTGNFIRAEQFAIESALQSHFALDAEENIYGFSSFRNAFLDTYDGDTSFSKIGPENGLVFKLSDEANRINLGNDKSICLGDSFLLQPRLIAGDEVKWNTGETTPILSVKNAGTYHVKVTNCGRVFRDTIVISTVLKPTVDLGDDTAFCEPVAYLIEPIISDASSYIWNTSDTTKNLLVDEAGEYILSAKNGPDCVVSDTINIDLLAIPDIFSFEDTVLCGLEEFVLNAGNSGSTYLWSNGETSQSITVNNDGTYGVEVSNAFCSATDSVKVTFLEEDECLPSIKLPNVFTPNNDGVNDVFALELKNILETELSIFDRWGELVFKSNSENIRWDGRYKGKELPAGNYFVVLQYSYVEWDRTEVITKQLKGSVTLLR